MVGPYIQYVDYFKSKDKLKALKAQLGKILLVFQHTVLKIAMIYTTSISFLNVLTKWRKIMIQFLFQ
ncbi:hypothetical protein ACIXNO_22225 [Bacteroides fragilis]